MTDDLANSEFAQLLRDMADVIDGSATDESGPDIESVIYEDATIPSASITDYGAVGKVTGIDMQQEFYVDEDGDIWITDADGTFDYHGTSLLTSNELQRLVAASEQARSD